MYKYLNVTISTGLAMFSMFFGAGNVVFPLDLGRVSGNFNVYAILGLLITAVAVPFIGLGTMFLFNGNYKEFFKRIGKIPGFIVITFLMALIGPFIAIPRCITLSFSSLQIYFPNMSLFLFSFLFSSILFIFTINSKKILNLLGKVLSPILIISLVTLIIKGLMLHPNAKVINLTKGQAFMHGLMEGYYTMDLLGAFFFSVVILIGLQRYFGSAFHLDDKKNKNIFFKVTFVSSLIGGSLLALIYTGFSFVASYYSGSLVLTQKDTALSILSQAVLGSTGGIIANLAIILACLTTAMTLAAVFSEFLQKEIFKNRLNYKTSLFFTLIAAFVISNLGFMGIIHFSKPILLIGYPVLIILTLLNLAYKLFDFKPVKIPIVITLVISTWFYFLK